MHDCCTTAMFFFYTFRRCQFLSLMVCTTIDEPCCYDLDLC
jgi:hypothetical protein